SITIYNAKGYLEPNRYNAYSLNNITAEKNADGRGSVRRLRRRDFELFADYGGLELHGAILSPARRSPERQMEIPRSAGRELNSVAGSADCVGFGHHTPPPGFCVLSTQMVRSDELEVHGD